MSTQQSPLVLTTALLLQAARINQLHQMSPGPRALSQKSLN